MRCELCIEITKEFLKENPDRKGYALCEECYEKSKEFYVYLNLTFDPKE